MSEPNSQPTPSSAPQPLPRIVLVAADEEHGAFTEELARAGFQADLVRAADSAQLQTALAGDVDLLLCGSKLPGFGWREVKAVCEGLSRDLAFVVYADEANDAAVTAAFEGGASDVVDRHGLGRLSFVLRRETQRARARAVSSLRTRIYEQIVDGLPFVLFVKDATTRRILVANQTFASAFGVTKEWLHGKLDHDYFPKEQADSFVDIDTEILEKKQLRVFEETARTDGVDRIYRTRKLPLLDADGNAAYLLGVTEDITEQKNAEEEMRRTRELSAKTLASYQRRALQMEIIRQQNEDLDRLAADLVKAKHVEEERGRELEAAVRLKSEFLANFSHEIRTPLNGILGYCDLVLREEGQRLTPHGRRDLHVVKQNARTLLALINDILDLSKIEAGRVDIYKETVDIEALLDECKSTVDQLLRGKEVELRIDVAHDAREVFTDSLKIRQVMLNLLSNAAKFTESGEIVATVTADGNDLVATVEDTGSGIPADQLPFIFEKFRQVDGAPTRKVGGTGLGLAIVREVANVLGGSVKAESTLGRGSTFTLRLPDAFGQSGAKSTRQEPAAAVVAKSEPSAQGTRPKVLVVDDDPMVYQMLAGHLEKEGYDVIRAADGIEGLARAREDRPQMILLDLHLPKLDGWKVLSRIKSDPAIASTPVIIVSVDEERARAFSFGACDYLVKPFEPERLTAAVRRSTSPNGGQVLVVDDDDSMRELVSRNLSAVGFSTIEASSGAEALTRTRELNPAMIVLDLLMPGIDGFEVIRTLRAENNQVPILVLTGKKLDDDEARILQEGMARVVTKNGVALEQVVREARTLITVHGAKEKSSLPRLLYVEDSAQNRDIVRRYLSGDFELFEAEDGEEGLEKAAEVMPELILMDLSLPRIDGWEATRRIKSNPALKHITVLAVTAHAGTEERDRAREVGCDEYLTKPIEREQLIATIRRHLEAARNK